jgi:phospholipid/cholesterol/gamma-HCH transport system substrate-binding protein
MRSRTIKEGSLGLFIFAGVSLLSVVLIWLTGKTFSQKTYTINARFANANGMREGASVRYRGLEVGRIATVKADTNGVNVAIEIQSLDLVIPKDVIVEANQAGLVGDTSLEIVPSRELNQEEMSHNPLDTDCQTLKSIVCHNDTIEGRIGVSFEQMLRSTEKFSSTFSDPEFVKLITTLTANSNEAAKQIAVLTKELTAVSKEVRGEIKTFSGQAQSITGAAVTSSNQLGQTLGKVNELTTNLNALVVENRQTIVSTLNSIGETGDRMQQVMVTLDGTLKQVNAGIASANTTELIGNLTTLTANAATASENLKDISVALNDPENVLALQKTLDAARVTFENTQKITSDLDELTGDPQFRKNLIDLVNGLSQLVSSTEQLQEQVQLANKLEPMRHELSYADRPSEPLPPRRVYQ